MTWRARLPATIAKFGDFMIAVTPCPHRYHRTPACRANSCLVRTPSHDYAKAASEILSAVGRDRRVFVYFQDKLGGEIGLSRTAARLSCPSTSPWWSCSRLRM